MKKQNFAELAKQNLQHIHWAAWFPYPTSWLKAMSLALSLAVILVIVRITGSVGVNLAILVDSPEVLAFFGIIAMLSPIVAIAFVHHILHLILGQFIPSFQPPEIGTLQGWFPGLISWWEGLYGWLAIFLATLTAVGLAILLMPLFGLSFQEITYEYNSSAETTLYGWVSTIWLVIAAGLYQIEYLVKQRIIEVYSVNNELKTSAANLSSSPDTEVDSLRGEMGMSQMKTNSKIPGTTSQSNRQKLRKPEKVAKIFLMFLVTSLTVIGIYLFSKLPQSQINAPIPVASQPAAVSNEIPSVAPTPVDSASPQSDAFKQAVNKASSAASITQSAKSKDDWNLVTRQWKEAIALMKAVPQTHPQHTVAQQKAIDYQRNLDYAQKNAASSQ
jgi:cell division protein FtsL